MRYSVAAEWLCATPPVIVAFLVVSFFVEPLFNRNLR